MASTGRCATPDARLPRISEEPPGIQAPLILESKHSPKPEDRIAVIGRHRVVGLGEDDESFYRGFSKKQRRRVRNKIDVRLLPILALLYMLAQLDRSNIGNAKVEGLKADTHLTDTEYNILLAAFFIPYCLFEVPSNMVLKKLQRPSRYIATLVVAWGAVMASHGFANDFSGLLVARLLLGTTESGFYPAAMFLCSQWYRPRELASRLSVFMAMAAVSGITSGLLAAAIRNMDGLAGYEGWRWLFFVEGGITIIVGVVTWFFLIDTPGRSSGWLTGDEIRYMEIEALIKEGGPLDEGSRASAWKDVLAIVADWRYWVFGTMLLVDQACAYGKGICLKFSIPSIIKGMGYTGSRTQLLSTIPYIFGFVSALAIPTCSDYFGSRAIPIIIAFSSSAIGFGMLLALVDDMATHKIAVIAGMCFVTVGVFPLSPVAGGWVSNNIATSGRRAAALAFVLSLGSLGGLPSGFMYVESQAPHFTLGFQISCVFACAGLLLCGALACSFWQGNKVKDAAPLERVRETYTEDELRRMGEKSPLFRYTL
ncbi:hypothetical protein S40288_01397 [Stachybotrys chartarum IBT 40288]|nr:hypothetical protein S40288_01397 [Stachybotrys chartarum IBT 40288]